MRVGGEVVAESTRPTVIFETGLPPRYYLPADDVRPELLEPSETRTGCAYKGFASYWSVRPGDTFEEDLVWSYPAPIPETPKIENLLAFYNEKTDIVVDGVPQERPVTKWS